VLIILIRMTELISIIHKQVDIVGSPTAINKMTDPRHKADIRCLQYKGECNSSTIGNDSDESLLERSIPEHRSSASSSPRAHRERAYSLHASAFRERTKHHHNRNRRKSIGSGAVSETKPLESYLSVPLDRFNLEKYFSSDMELQGGTSDDSSGDDTARVRRVRSFKERPERPGGELRRVRSFKTTSKGLVNRGDSFKSRKSESISYKQLNGVNNGVQNANVEKIANKNYIIPKVVMTQTDDQQRYFRVLMLGSGGVGKTSIIDQFMTSEFLGGGNFNICKSLSNYVLLVYR